MRAIFPFLREIFRVFLDAALLSASVFGPLPPFPPKTCSSATNSACSSSGRSGLDEPAIRSDSLSPGSPDGSIGGMPSS
jgi:hypothetical protein